MVTVLRNLWGAGLVAGVICLAADLRAEDAVPPAPAGEAPAGEVPAPAGKATVSDFAIPDSLRSKPHDPSKVGMAHLECGGCCQPGCPTCRKKRKCCLCGKCLLDNLACCDSCIDEHHFDCLDDRCIDEALARLHGHADALHAELRELIRRDCETKKRHFSREYLHRRYGYFCPQGSCGEGTPFLGHYHMGYAVNPYHFDPRDAGVYAAQGFGVPMAVPLPPMVEHTYNYGWGVPSSRLTGIYRYYQEPGVIGPPTLPLSRGLVAGAYTGTYSADRFIPAPGAKPIKPGPPALTPPQTPTARR